MGLFFAPSPRQTHFDLALAGATVINSRAAEIAGAQGGGTGQKGSAARSLQRPHWAFLP